MAAGGIVIAVVAIVMASAAVKGQQTSKSGSGRDGLSLTPGGDDSGRRHKWTSGPSRRNARSRTSCMCRPCCSVA